MLAAAHVALSLNCHVCSVSEFLANVNLSVGLTRSARTGRTMYPAEASHAVVIDDSIDSGRSMHRIRTQIEPIASARGQKLSFGAVYMTPGAESLVDFHLETVPHPRIFEWNLMHRANTRSYCFDIDGVLCEDPSHDCNDDGPRYLDFIRCARPLAVPTHPLGHLVTSRLERYRAETEAWLRANGVEYEALHMLDLPSAEARRRLRAHASFKAGIYKQITDSRLFVESEPHQAEEIARLSGKPVLCFSTQQLHLPSSVTRVLARTRRNPSLLKKALRQLARRLL